MLQSRLCKAPAAGTRSLSPPRCMSKQGCKGLLPSSSLTNGDDRQNVHFIAHYGHRPTERRRCKLRFPQSPSYAYSQTRWSFASLPYDDDGMGERATGRDGGRAEKAVCTVQNFSATSSSFPHPPFLAANFGFPSSHPPASCWLLLLAISQLLPPPPLSPVRPPLRATQSEEDKWQQFGGGRSERGGSDFGGAGAVGSSQKSFSGGWRSAEEGGGRKSRGRNKSAKRGRRGNGRSSPHNLPNFLPVKRGSIARAHPPPTRALSVSRVAVRGFIAGGGGENERSNVQIRTFMLPSPGRDCLRE